MRVAKLILVVEPGTGRTSKLVPIQQKEIHNGHRELHLSSRDRKGNEDQKDIPSHPDTTKQLDFVPQDQYQNGEWKSGMEGARKMERRPEMEIPRYI
jgi:hypothetical protein